MDTKDIKIKIFYREYSIPETNKATDTYSFSLLIFFVIAAYWFENLFANNTLKEYKYVRKLRNRLPFPLRINVSK